MRRSVDGGGLTASVRGLLLSVAVFAGLSGWPDLLQLNGKDLRNLPVEQRKAKLEALLKKPPGLIRYSVSFTDVQELLSRTRDMGLEGLIGKRRGSKYEPGKRRGAWIKLKLHQEPPRKRDSTIDRT